MGGKLQWNWMEMVESQDDAPKNYFPKLQESWRTTRPCGINYKEDSSKEDTQDMVARLDGMASDLAASQGT